MSKQVYWRFKDSRYWTHAKMIDLGNGLVRMQPVYGFYEYQVLALDEIDVKEVA